MQLTIRAAAAGAAMMVAAHWCSSLHAQTQQQVDACEGKGNLPLDTVTGSCTALIQSGNYLARDLSTVFVIRAIACQRKGDLDRAIQDYDHAIGLDPGGATAYYNRGAAYGSKGDWIAPSWTTIRRSGISRMTGLPFATVAWLIRRRSSWIVLFRTSTGR